MFTQGSGEMQPKIFHLLGYNISFFDSIGSTHTYAMERVLHDNAHHSDIFQALLQTAGIGTKGRAWISPPGSQLAMTMVINPMHYLGENLSYVSDVAYNSYSEISYIASVSLAKAILSLKSDAKVGLKWINDVMIGGRKVAGILISLTKDVKGRRVIILSIGCNIESSPSADTLSGGGSAKRVGVTSLSEEGVLCTLNDLRDKFLFIFSKEYNGWLDGGISMAMKWWKERDELVGKRVIVSSHFGAVTGISMGMSSDGYLLIQYDADDSSADIDSLEGAIFDERRGVIKLSSGNLTIL